VAGSLELAAPEVPTKAGLLKSRFGILIISASDGKTAASAWRFALDRNVVAVFLLEAPI